MGASYLAIGCSENVFPYTDRARVCNSFGIGDAGNTYGSEGWGSAPYNGLLALCLPVLVLLLSQAIPWLRRHALPTALAILVVTVAGWTFLLLVVSSNIGDTTSF